MIGRNDYYAAYWIAYLIVGIEELKDDTD